MLFNSIDFAIFLPIVFGLYWLIGSQRIRWQNAFILLVSYVFYGWWDYRFLGLIAFSSLVDYVVGNLMSEGASFGQRWGASAWEKRRKVLLWTSIIANIGMLACFKYFDFFVDNFVQAFSLFGKELNVGSLDIILPVGISFYTFQTLSYTIDVYRKKMEPTKDIVAFFAYVSFFPQLVAGPIERAKNLLPQFHQERHFEYELARNGALQIVWGLFKKVVIADSCAIHANYIFEHHQEVNSSTLLLGLLYFLFQVYCDFSGYSDMAIGLGKLLGFKLMKNFDYPFFSRDIPEFWRKWHISLTSWFVDYIYIPLGGSRKGTLKKIRNVLIIFLVSGFWHGANWTYVLWGLFCGMAFIPYMITNSHRKYVNAPIDGQKLLPSLREFSGMMLVGVYIMLSMVLFRSENIQEAWAYSIGLFSFKFHPFDLGRMDYIWWILCLLVWEWFFRTKEHGLEMDHWPQWLRWLIYMIVIWAILYYFGKEETYIYFQF